MSEMLLNGMPFDDYLVKYEIYEKTSQFMMEYLKNWYDDDPKDFREHCGQITGLWQKPISLSGKLPHLRKTIGMTRLCSALRSVWTSMMMRVIIRQFTPHFLTLTATALTTS